MEEDALEIGPGGIVTPTHDPFGLYIIYSGTPNDTCNLFGYWHINDVDEVYITIGGKAPDDEATRLILMRYPKPGERDMFAWYCRECVSLLYCFVHDTGSRGFETFWKAESEAVCVFNTDTNLRRCKNYGAEHPLDLPVHGQQELSRGGGGSAYLVSATNIRPTQAQRCVSAQSAILRTWTPWPVRHYDARMHQGGGCSGHQPDLSPDRTPDQFALRPSSCTARSARMVWLGS